MGCCICRPDDCEDGIQDIATDEEVFFQTTIPDIHPRTAAGVDAEGRLLLLVVDGRQSASRGVSWRNWPP